MKSRRSLVAVLGAAALALTACTSDGGPGADGDELVDGKTFTMALGTDPGTLDPTMTVMSSARNVGRFLYARLVSIQEDGTIAEALAESWEGDTTTATFTLRDGVTCDNGDPLTATDVAANIEFIADPANQSPLLGLLVQPGSTATADDAARTVTVTSGAADAFLLHNLGSVPIVCGYGLEDREVLAGGEAATGMFTIDEIVPNDHYTLVRRKDYTWGPGDWDPDQKGLPDTVVVRVIPNETTAANLLLSGELNAAPVLGPDAERLHGQDLFHSNIEVPVGQLWFNEAEGRPTADPEVRRALVQAQDLGTLRTVLAGDNATVPTGLVTIAPRPCTDDSVSGNVPEFDVEAAEAALDAAGWTVGSDGIRTKDGNKLELTMIYLTNLGDTTVAAAELAQQTWREVGVDIELRGVDNPGLNEMLFNTGAWDISTGPVTPTLPTQLIPFLSGPTPPNGTNFGHYVNEEYAAAVAQASTKPGTEGCADWAAAEAAAIQAVDVVPFANMPASTFGRGSRFVVDDGLDPASIRMYE